MLGQLLAYDADGNVTASLDYLVQRDPEDPDKVIGLHDFGAEEANGYEFDTEAHTDGGGVWHVPGAAGSKVWPQWLKRPTTYRVERDGPPGKRPIVALVHRETGTRVERETVERRISERIAQANGKPADIRDIVGGPNRAIEPEKPDMPRLAKRA